MHTSKIKNKITSIIFVLCLYVLTKLFRIEHTTLMFHLHQTHKQDFIKSNNFFLLDLEGSMSDLFLKY